MITVREAARLHGYPDWFRFHITKWNGFREIGNSVPVMLGRAVAAELLKADNITPTRGEFTPLGNEALLSFTATEARIYFGLTGHVIPQRNRAQS
ncbi:DNA cytosine methyltransferase [Actinotignum timonense]|uniref:DNA cytosine methyltransferase n=1 Tax=Actinotignum TaxID=1653174 RepID=UPI003306AE3D|nr:DNA cytosine methyltransferase [Actinotignum schaalii]